MPNAQQENRDLWIAALRSREYKRGFQQLVRANHYCCLGVACDVLRYPKVLDEFIFANLKYDNYYPASFFSEDFGVPEVIADRMITRASAMNDAFYYGAPEYSNDDIATYLENSFLAYPL